MTRTRKESKERAIEMKDIGLPGLAMKQREYGAMRMVKESKERAIEMKDIGLPVSRYWR
jgi:hypothetical protein